MKQGIYLAGVAAILIGATVGCDRKEEILDAETPNGEVEIERDLDTGEIDVDVDEE